MLLLTVYSMNVCYYFYIPWIHFSKVIWTSEEFTTDTLEVISASTRVILTTEEVITTPVDVLSPFGRISPGYT